MASQQANHPTSAGDPSPDRKHGPSPSSTRSPTPSTTGKGHSTTGISTPSSPALKRSPNSSRTTSPTRKATTGPPNTLQSARTKSAALGPDRAGASTPSAAAVQRALSAANVELLRPSVTAQVSTKGPSKAAPRPENSVPLRNTIPQSPLSPRAKSPTSSASSRRSSLSSVKISDSEQSEQPKPARPSVARSAEQAEGHALPAPPNTPTGTKALRGPSGLGTKLETVDEAEQSAMPNDGQSNDDSKKIEQDKKMDKIGTDSAGTRPAGNADTKINQQAENKLANHDVPTHQRSNSSLAPAKTRSAYNEGYSKSMTVETETVSSIPQTAIGGHADRAGSLRLKPSNETIRPKKEKKKTAKKAPSIISTAGSSKADIFEAKVASEIECGDSDSDETFVYESNPPEPRSRSSRHHSRTPSSTSVQTLGDGKGHLKTFGSLFSSDRPVRPKRSMKFASNSYAGSSMDDEASDRNGTVRTSNPTATPRHALRYKHIGRFGRDKGGSDSPVEHDSPFSLASKMRVGTGPGGSQSPLKSGSPRSLTPTPLQGSPRHDPSSYEYDSGGISDERSPLMGSLRTPRTRAARHPTGSHLRHMEYYVEPRRSWARRLIGCIIIAFTIVLVILFGAGFLFATARPLYAVSLREIQNVLASEQELMFDLLVEGTNPNIAQVTISEMDINVFAKSRHVSAHALYPTIESGHRSLRARRDLHSIPTPHDIHDHLLPHDSTPVQPYGGVDDGTDPIEDPDPETDRQTMLLGRIFHFDSSISFEPSPIRRESHLSAGELRLPRPGNKTETGGSQRWERVIEHPFELIVRGVLKYRLPLNTHTTTSSVGARVMVHPEDGVDEKGSMRVVQLGHLLALHIDA